MPDGITIEFEVHIRRRARGRREISAGAKPPMPGASAGAVPRVARLMAPAIRFEELVRTGEVSDYAEIARLGHVSRTRVSQIMNLLTLAPDIQDDLLALPASAGRDRIGESDLRFVAASIDWGEQRRRWRELAACALRPS
jgi:hypothetical protein